MQKPSLTALADTTRETRQGPVELDAGVLEFVAGGLSPRSGGWSSPRSGGWSSPRSGGWSSPRSGGWSATPAGER